MPEHDASSASTTDGLPIAPSLGPGLRAADFQQHSTALGARVVFLSAVAPGMGLAPPAIAELLTRLIALVTQLSFYGRLSTETLSPAHHHLGPLVLGVP